jgi:hypothetical protein
MSGNISNVNSEVKKMGRKRSFPAQNRIERKKLCNKNESYNSARGVEIKPKGFKFIQTCCTKNCWKNVEESDQKKLFNDYHRAGSFEVRSSFLYNNVHEVPTMMKMKTMTSMD